MEENLQNALSNLIGKALNGLDATKTFLESEIPDVINQLLLWHGVYNFILMIGSIFYLIIIFCLYKISCNIMNKEGFKFWVGPYEADPSFGLIKIIIIFFTSIALLIESLIIFNMTWLQIWIAPKIFLIEYMADLAK